MKDKPWNILSMVSSFNYQLSDRAHTKGISNFTPIPSSAEMIWKMTWKILFPSVITFSAMGTSFFEWENYLLKENRSRVHPDCKYKKQRQHFLWVSDTAQGPLPAAPPQQRSNSCEGNGGFFAVRHLPFKILYNICAIDFSSSAERHFTIGLISLMLFLFWVLPCHCSRLPRVEPAAAYPHCCGLN